MIYKVWVKEGVAKSAETVDTSNPDAGSPCATWKEYMGYMSDSIDFQTAPIPYGTLKPDVVSRLGGRGVTYYVESETLGGAVVKVERILAAERVKG
jgi:hypothetical protein